MRTGAQLCDASHQSYLKGQRRMSNGGAGARVELQGNPVGGAQSQGSKFKPRRLVLCVLFVHSCESVARAACMSLMI